MGETVLVGYDLEIMDMAGHDRSSIIMALGDPGAPRRRTTPRRIDHLETGDRGPVAR